MAKQVGPYFFTGCLSGLTFYKMDGQYYVRQKSSLSRKRVLKSPAFKRTMENAGVFAKASKIAAKIYRSMDMQTRDRSVYNKLTGMVNRMLKEGKEEAEIVLLLFVSQEHCERNIIPKSAAVKKVQDRAVVTPRRHRLLDSHKGTKIHRVTSEMKSATVLRERPRRFPVTHHSRLLCTFVPLRETKTYTANKDTKA